MLISYRVGQLSVTGQWGVYMWVCDNLAVWNRPQLWCHLFFWQNRSPLSTFGLLLFQQRLQRSSKGFLNTLMVMLLCLLLPLIVFLLDNLEPALLYHFYIMSILTVWYCIPFWVNGYPLWKTQKLLLDYNTGTFSITDTLIPFSTGNLLSLRMWYGCQPNRPLEWRRPAVLVFSTPCLKTASMRTSSVSDTENAKTHVIDQISLWSMVKIICQYGMKLILIYYFFLIHYFSKVWDQKD